MKSWSSWTFILLTCFYFYLKNKSNKGSFNMIEKGLTPFSLFPAIYFIIYIAFIFSSQVGSNFMSLNNVCPNNANNYLTATYCVLVGWIFIFLVMVGVVFFTSMSNVNMISAFSDVFGYYWVANNMNVIFSKIMYPTSELKNTIDASKNKDKLEIAAETIMRTTNSYFLLVNTFTPYNFKKRWDNLSPLMKDGMANNTNLMEELYYNVLLRHNIGECFWYLYTGIFVSSYVSYIVLKTGCAKTVTQLETEMDDVPEPNNNGPTTINKTYNPTL